MIWTPALLDFAQWFSENYKTLPIGEYPSGKDDIIRYVLADHMSDKKPFWLARTHRSYPEIELQKDALLANDAFTPDYVFYLVLWCFCKPTRDYMEADRATAGYYLTTGRSKKNLFNGFTAHLRHALSDMNLRRIDTMAEILQEPPREHNNSKP